MNERMADSTSQVSQLNRLIIVTSRIQRYHLYPPSLPPLVVICTHNNKVTATKTTHPSSHYSLLLFAAYFGHKSYTHTLSSHALFVSPHHNHLSRSFSTKPIFYLFSYADHRFLAFSLSDHSVHRASAHLFNLSAASGSFLAPYWPHVRVFKYLPVLPFCPSGY